MYVCMLQRVEYVTRFRDIISIAKTIYSWQKQMTLKSFLLHVIFITFMRYDLPF